MGQQKAKTASDEYCRKNLAVFTILEQRWLDECVFQLHLDFAMDALDIVAAQKAILFLAEHTEWFNYAVSQSRWCASHKTAPVMADDYIKCESLPEVREKMAILANRPRSVVRVHPPLVGQEIHHTTCAWLEVTVFEGWGRRKYFALRTQFNRGDFNTTMTTFKDYLVEASFVTQTTVWDLSSASDILDRILSDHRSSRVASWQNEGSRTLKCLIIDTIREADSGLTTRVLVDMLFSRFEAAVHAGQRFEDLDLLGGQIVVGAKELTKSALNTRVGEMKRALELF